MYNDGTVQRVSTDGVRTMEFPDGQKEIHTTEYKVCVCVRIRTCMDVFMI